MVRELRRTQKQGCHTVLLSGGYAGLMEFVGKTMGFHTIIGTELCITGGVVDAKSPLDIVSGQEKAERLRLKFDGQPVDWANSCAFADSLSDVPILRMVGHPIVVSPDEGLKDEAACNAWPILTE